MIGNRLGLGVQPPVRDAIGLLFDASGLPAIAGKWYYVDPKSGSDSAGGLTYANSLASIKAAYDLCLDGVGDGIVIVSRGSSTSADTTSYMEAELAWTKSGITVFGIAAPTTMFQRSRIANKVRAVTGLTTISFDETDGVYSILDSANGFIAAGFSVGQKVYVSANSGTNSGIKTIASVAAGVMTVAEAVTDEDAATAGATTITSYCLDLITVSGHNNTFINLSLFNGSSLVQALGCLKVTGNRNAFINVHAVGGGHATPAGNAGMYSLYASGEENTYYGCTFGTDSIIRAAANGEIRFAGTCRRNAFEKCRVISYSTTAGKGAIISAGADSIDGWTLFKDCVFTNWNTGALSALTSAFIGTKPNNLGLLMQACILIGWAAWDSVGANDRVYVACSDATASGAGGIATTT